MGLALDVGNWHPPPVQEIKVVVPIALPSIYQCLTCPLNLRAGTNAKTLICIRNVIEKCIPPFLRRHPSYFCLWCLSRCSLVSLIPGQAAFA